MKITELISGNNFTLTELNQMLNDPEPTIELKFDFWGSRILTVNGDSVKLSAVAQRIFAIGDTVFEKNLPLHERCSGVGCVNELRRYYNVTDNIRCELNCISYFILRLKMFFQIGEEKRCFNELTGFNETLREKTQTYENFRGFKELHFKETFPEERQLPSCRDGALFYYKGNRMPNTYFSIF